MDMKAIRALAEIMKANDLTQVEITEEGKTIRMKREIAAVPVPAQTPFAPVMPAPAAVPVSEVFHETPQQGVVIESPMVGMYYASPTPGAEPFVKTGSCVKKVMCCASSKR